MTLAHTLLILVLCAVVQLTIAGEVELARATRAWIVIPAESGFMIFVENVPIFKHAKIVQDARSITDFFQVSRRDIQIDVQFHRFFRSYSETVLPVRNILWQ